jgi:hypothetical protein
MPEESDPTKNSASGPGQPGGPESRPSQTNPPDRPSPDKPSPIEVMSNVADKLTDVLNLGRILSIGVPGFVIAFALLMLLIRLTTQFEIPRQALQDARAAITGAHPAAGHGRLEAGFPGRRPPGRRISCRAQLLPSGLDPS